MDDSRQPDVDGMEEISLPECESLLRAGGIGILALAGVAAPVLRPVNFVLHEARVLIRTGEGQILEAAHTSKPASFVINEADRLEHTGWSVIVTGRLSECSSSVEPSEIPLRPWARAEKQHFVALSMDEISGRRIAEGPRGA